MGYVWVGIVLAMMIGNEIVNWFRKKFSKQKVGFIVLGVMVGLFMSVAAISDTFAVLIVGFAGFELVRGLISPYMDTAIQENIPSKTRATIDSFVSMMARGATGIGLLISGWIAKEYGMDIAWLVSGLVIILLMPLVMIFNGKSKLKEV